MRTTNRKPLAKHRVAEHFTSLSEAYNQRNYVLAGKRGKYPDIAIRHRYFLEMLEGTSGRVLEIGCGSGQMLCDLTQRGYQVVGIDIAPGMIRATRTLLHDRLGVEAQLTIADVESLCFPTASFDVVLAAGVIEYLDSDERCLGEVSRVLRPGGTVLLSVRNKLNLARGLTTARDLLASAPVVGPGFEKAGELLRSWLPGSRQDGFPGRRHIPRQLRRALRRAGLVPTDSSFYHFAVFPRFMERRFGDFCVRWEQKLEVLRRTALGYFANQYIVKAVKPG